ncbi:MAG: ABC transporter ATP-binding protein/permease [Acholeplasmatales bacterium]|nr:ABC transporter ATP-binding protein/permease [Acholeplasmatales bacterium]
MLKLKNITKQYIVADMKVDALKGISLNFRKNEFVSILGPSGCGKTTTLNIIGGLDKYTDGDLFINGRSTKEFNDRDWDVYRNHRIGFIFQSYNLIPHQTVLGNVELALTISGISKKERIERAKKALDRVGLAGQYNKHPNQLSGGQCQRVAIARALVNEPEILLADEPTGALDTETSVQIMDLIKEIATEKLVIMVTHNPDLAYKYSTRIINLLDGEVKDDSNPFTEEEEAQEIAELRKAEEEREKADLSAIDSNDKAAVKAYQKKKNSKERAKMSFWTAFKLSARNLWSKRKRTFMVGIAGSIGIVGVSTVLAVSTGVNDYIDNLQNDMLSGYPIEIAQTSFDYSTMMDSSSFQSAKEALEAGDWVNVNSMIAYLVQNEKALTSLVTNNEIDENYVNYVMSMPKDYYSAIKLNYGIDVTNNIYTDFTVGDKERATLNQSDYNVSSMSLSAITNVYSQAITHIDQDAYAQYSEIITSLTTPMSQCIDNNDYISQQYDIVAGHLPEKSTDVIIVVDDEQEMTDLVLAQLGYYTQDDFYQLVYHALTKNDSSLPQYSWKSSFTYDELLNKQFTWYPNDYIYKTDEGPDSVGGYLYNYDMSNASDEAKAASKTLNVVGIVKPKDTVSYGSLSRGLLYTEELAREMININKNSEIARAIKGSSYGIQSGENSGYSLINDSALSSSGMKRSDLDGMPMSTLTAMGKGKVYELLDSTYVETEDTTIESGKNYYLYYKISLGVYYDMTYYWEKLNETFDDVIYGEDTTRCYVGETNQMSQMLSLFGISLGSSYRSLTLNAVAGSSTPASISIYPVDFDSKTLVTDYLDAWNEEKTLTFNDYYDDDTDTYDFSTVLGSTTLSFTERTEIKYTDTVGLIISLISTMITIITYALVAFTALSLVVSSVMIAIITYVSVMERVKEIGVIRSLGGRKKDVSHLFNAETFIIGAVSGLIGIVVTYVLQLIINVTITALSDGAVKVIANLTPITAIIMILISIFLTAISGFIPARSAAKKDPVVALRTE